MFYTMKEIEISAPLPTLSVEEGGSGVALLLRHEGRPVGFCMEPLKDKSVVTPQELAVKIKENTNINFRNNKGEREKPQRSKRIALPSLTIAVCTNDRPEILWRCLNSVKNLPHVALNETVTLDILVVDNAPSSDKTQEVVSSLDGVRYVCEPKPGLNFARNRALSESGGDLLAFLDDDVTVDHYWLTGLMEAWAENQDAGGYTGLVMPYELSTEAQIIFERGGGFRKGFNPIRFSPNSAINRFYPCDAGIFGVGANMAFPRNILQKLGGFDEALDTGSHLPGGGDLDIFYRIIRSGHALVYKPDYMVFHQHRRELAELRKQYGKSWGTGYMAFVEKCYRTDPSQRAKLHRLIVWWFMRLLWQFQKSLTGKHPLPPRVILSQLRGGLVGLLGGYSRSTKRLKQVREKFAYGP